jgi:glycosyltransferase involved in cell wall biosynthesis
VVHRLLRTFNRHVDRFVVPSRFYMDKLAEWGWNRERFVHIPNAIDTKAFDPDYHAGKNFLYFGRLSREKGLSTLIQAASLAGVPLQIAGTGPDDRALRELADATGSNVSFLGYLKGSALHDAIRSSRAVVLPSEWYENAPLSVMEAYALGKPVIGAAIGGIPELIQGDNTGSTFNSGSIENLASVLTRFERLPDARISDMGRAGRDWMATDFSMRQYGARMLELYGDLGVR